MSEELGRNEYYAACDKDGTCDAESLSLDDGDAMLFVYEYELDRVARVTLIESAALAKVREALEHIWEILHHEGFDDTADYCTRTLALLEPPQ